MTRIRRPLWPLLALAAAGAAHGQALRDLCPDRPLKGVSACSLDKGHWQVEADIINLTHDRSDGVSTDQLLVANPTLKYGVSDTVDLEANLPFYQQARVRGGGLDSKDSGIGDLTLLAKWHVAGTNGQDGVAIVPFIKLPTAKRALGNGAVEGGVFVPWQANLAGGWSINVTPEVDVFKNQDDSGRHAAATASVGLTHPVAQVFNIGFELWGRRDFDPAHATSQWSFDTALVWQPKGADYAFDAEIDLGLNRQTPDAQFIIGVAKRF